MYEGGRKAASCETQKHTEFEIYQVVVVYLLVLFRKPIRFPKSSKPAGVDETIGTKSPVIPSGLSEPSFQKGK